MKAWIWVFVTVMFIINIGCGRTEPPKREFRGVWVATVVNLDWPSSKYANSENQIQELQELFEQLHSCGINAIIFQVRDECDALYESQYDPWSYYLTGQQGAAPDPFYDPLQIAVRTAHQLGMELHAWFNPYRAEVSIDDHYMAPGHVTKQHEDWIFIKGTRKHLDPGIPDVRNYVTNVVMDVVNRYDVDGIHFDDYFYPYDPITDEDAATFANYPRGFSDIDNWRRDNVNLLIEAIHDSIQTVKPWVKFGISPFGIWKSGTPAGIVGLSSYDVLYCDPVYWLQEQIIDYVTPQCYWPTGGGQDYSKLVPWWATQLNGRHLYVGQAAYRAATWSSREIPAQIQINRTLDGCWESIFFRAKMGILNNPNGVLDSLRNHYYRYPAILPSMNWKDNIPPNSPSNLVYQYQTKSGSPALAWMAPTSTDDSDTVFKYVIYRFNSPEINSENYSDPRNIQAVSGQVILDPGIPPENGPYYYQVAALDRNHNESQLGNLLEIIPPGVPQLVSPTQHALNQRDTIQLRWISDDLVSAFHIQLAEDSIFADNLIVDQEGIRDSVILITQVKGMQDYFWRVSSANAGGYSPFSDIYHFKTGFPVITQLAQPTDGKTDVAIRPTLTWHPVDSADYYQIQLATSRYFGSYHNQLDSSGIADTALTVGPLTERESYYWRVRATNSYGRGEWSQINDFTVESIAKLYDMVSEPLRYQLNQNYPNPFNAITRLRFTIPEFTDVTIRVYNINGKLIEEIVQPQLPPGQHSITFDASGLASGVYVYQLITAQFSTARKMILLR